MKTKLFTLLLLGISFYANAQVTEDLIRKGKKSDKDLKAAFKETVPTSVHINFLEQSSRASFFNKFKKELSQAQQLANTANFRINQRLRGIKAARRLAKDTIKRHYLHDFDSIAALTGNQDKALKELRAGFHKSVFDLRVSVNIQYRRVFEMAESKSVFFFPARNSRFSQLYYDYLKDSTYLVFLREQFVSFNDEFGALSSELVAGHAGPFRLSLNTAISKARRDDLDPATLEGKTEEDIQLLVQENYESNLSKNTLSSVVAGGGLVGLKLQYPLFYLNPLWTPNFRFDSEFACSFSGDFKTAGTSTPQDKMGYWFSPGIHTNAYLPLIAFSEQDEAVSVFGLFFQYNISRISGSNTFYDNLNLGSDRNGFWFGEFRTGLFYNGIQITYAFMNFSNKQLDKLFPNTFKIAFAPGKSKAK